MSNLSVKTDVFSKPLEELERERAFALAGTSPIYKYDADRKRTSEIIGTRYSVVNLKTLKFFDVKVPGAAALVSQEQIEAAPERIFVTFENAVVKPYKIEFRNVQCTVTADSAKLVTLKQN